jgi:hypothetical protein
MTTKAKRGCFSSRSKTLLAFLQDRQATVFFTDNPRDCAFGVVQVRIDNKMAGGNTLEDAVAAWKHVYANRVKGG